jgi:hypothetical protein
VSALSGSLVLLVLTMFSEDVLINLPMELYSTSLSFGILRSFFSVAAGNGHRPEHVAGLVSHKENYDGSDHPYHQPFAFISTLAALATTSGSGET